uniref:Uncharacterized protein n=1 Tax=Arundo donax TaxID=35708 RepID=A0A0A8YN19_ARUDO
MLSAALPLFQQIIHTSNDMET